MSDVLDKKQKILLEYAMSDRACFIKIARIMQPEHFSPPLNRVVEFVLDFFSKHHDIPDVDIIDAEIGVQFVEREMDDADRSYLLEEIEMFCQQQAMINAVEASLDLIEENKLNEMQELFRKAAMIRLEPNLGINLFDDVEFRISHTEDANDPRSCGIEPVNALVGDCHRGELGFIYAVSSGGKSVALANIGKNMSLQGLRVAVVSLELNEQLYAKRVDAIFSGIDIKNHLEFKADVAEHMNRIKSQCGPFTIKKMKFGTTVEDIRAYVMEYHLMHGVYPDVLIVDYLALMGISGSMSKFMNKFDVDEIKAFGLRDIMIDFGMYGFSAGQLNRDGYDVMEINASHCAGGMSVINASDWAIGLVANEEDKDNNQVRAIQIKVRNHGTESLQITYRDPKNLQMSGSPSSTHHMNSTASQGKQSAAQAPEKVTKKKDAVLVDGSKKDKLKKLLAAAK